MIQAIRRKCIRREIILKYIGLIFIVSGVIAALFWLINTKTEYSHNRAEHLYFAIGMVLRSLVAILGGLWLRKLWPAGRILCTVFCCTVIVMSDPYLLPISAPTCFVFLFLLWTKPANRIFKQAYRKNIIPQTPDVKSAIKKAHIALLALPYLLTFLACIMISFSQGILSFEPNNQPDLSADYQELKPALKGTIFEDATFPDSTKNPSTNK